MEIVQFHNPGVISNRLPEDLFLKLKIELDKIRKEITSTDTDVRKNLQVLSIKEILYTPYLSELENFINDTFLTWCKTFNQRFDVYQMGNVWTNYMKPGEFAPAHSHGNSIASFVIWINIPYQRNDEESYHFHNRNSYQRTPGAANFNGEFQFFYSDLLGKLASHKINLDKSHEGMIIMFPGSMMHMVYPFFSSDQERISIAGNIAPVSHATPAAKP